MALLKKISIVFSTFVLGMLVLITPPAHAQIDYDIIFIGGDTNFYLLTAASSQPTIIASDILSIELSWSPDKSKIAYTAIAHAGENDFEIHVMNIDGSNQTRLTDNDEMDVNPVWSPDGTKIAFSSNRSGSYEVYVMDADGSNQTNLTNNPDGNLYPSWSPDGSKIAFTSARDGNYEIYVMNADGSNQQRITNDPGSDSSPSWSPDGSRIAFRQSEVGGGCGALSIMNPDGSNLIRLADGICELNSIHWLADSSTIFYQNYAEIYSIKTDGTLQQLVVTLPGFDPIPGPFDIHSEILVLEQLGTGLRGEYFDNADFTAFKFARINAQVNFDWGTGAPDPIMVNNTYSVRWVGKVETLYVEPYTFYVTHNDGARLWVNGQQIINTWSNTTNAVESSGVITLAANQRYDILLEYYENTDNASVKLEWASASQTREVIPQVHLYPPEGQLAFTGTTSGNSEIYVKNPDGSGELLVGTSFAADNYAVWSPDGTKIAFVSTRDGNEEIYVVNVDGTGLLRLTNHASYDRSPTWSPDGARIAFVSGRGGDDNIWVVNANGSSLIKFTANTAQDTDPTWSPTGRFISFMSTRGGGDPNLWIMKGSDGTNEIQITTQAGYDLAPYWSPDGSKVAFRRNTSGNDDIWVVNTTSPYTRTRLTNHPSADFFQSWSPDGSKILFLSTRDGNSELYTIDATGSEVTGTLPVRLTNTTTSESYGVWSADGRQIAFIRSNDIHIMNSDGSNERRITTAGRSESQLSWWQPRQAY